MQRDAAQPTKRLRRRGTPALLESYSDALKRSDRKWRRKAEAVAHAKEPQFEVTSAIVLGLGSNEIVFAEPLVPAEPSKSR
jgi:hypothetical protein